MIEREAWATAGADTWADAFHPIWKRVQAAADAYFAPLHARAVAHYNRQRGMGPDDSPAVYGRWRGRLVRMASGWPDPGPVSLARWGKASNANTVARERYETILAAGPRFCTEREKIEAAIAHERAEGEFELLDYGRQQQIRQAKADRKAGIVRRPIRHRKHVRSP